MSFIPTVGLSRRSALQLAVGAIAAASEHIQPTRTRSGRPDRLRVTLLAGEPSRDSVLLQARFATSQPAPASTSGGSRGVAGRVRFEVSDDPRFTRTLRTAWVRADEASDFIAKVRVTGLEPGRRYHYRAKMQADLHGDVLFSPRRPEDVGSFTTVGGSDFEAPVSLALFSCLSYEFFYGLGVSPGNNGPWRAPATGRAFERGYPGMDDIASANVDFLVSTGDTVYYDHPNSDQSLWAFTVPQMREKWHRQLALPAVSRAFASTATFFMKDDHDFRFDDADNTGDQAPTAEDGRAVFLEQTPSQRDDGLPYRTVRLSKHLQVWLLEGRDFRSPNAEPDDGDKTLWGVQQREWLQRTLLESSADFKIVVSPTPVIGPDDVHKSDSHPSSTGFLKEGEEFLAFLQQNDLVESTHLVNGDRHWQYHSIHPTGVNEYSSGTIHRQNSRPGVPPGSPRGTDWEGRIEQPFLQPVPDGGYIRLEVRPDGTGAGVMEINFVTEDGEVLYTATKRAPARTGAATPTVS